MKKHRIYIFSFFSLLTTRPNNSEKQQFTVSIAFKKNFCKTKKNTIDDEQKKQVAFTKQRLLLYKEDFGNFVEALNECVNFIDMSDNEQDVIAKQLSGKSDFDDIDFDI